MSTKSTNYGLDYTMPDQDIGKLAALSSDSNQLTPPTNSAQPTANLESQNTTSIHPPKLSPNGLPLLPQPTSSPHDPLNFPPWLKLTTLLLISTFALLSFLSASLITPSLSLIASEFHRTDTEAAYLQSVFILFVGLGAGVWNPISEVWGRRVCYLVSAIGCTVVLVAEARVRGYAGLLVLRAVNGVFAAVPAGLGSSTVCDLFFEHERGRWMGVYTLFWVSAGHLAPLLGGFIEKALQWRWCLYIGAMGCGGLIVVFAVALPETLRGGEEVGMSWRQNMLCHRTLHPTRRLRARDFIRPWRMLHYPSVLCPTLYYAASFAFGSVMLVITGSGIFRTLYSFQPYQTGLLLGVPLTLGGIMGEALAGRVSDWISSNRALRRGGARKPEDRLLALGPALVLLPLGVMVEGVCIHYRTHWSGIGMGIGMASLGLQIAQTVVYAYTAESYHRQTAEIGVVVSVVRSVVAFVMGFVALPLAGALGFMRAWIVFAVVIVGLSVPMVGLLKYGEGWRVKMGSPDSRDGR